MAAALGTLVVLRNQTVAAMLNHVQHSAHVFGGKLLLLLHDLPQLFKHTLCLPDLFLVTLEVDTVTAAITPPPAPRESNASVDPGLQKVTMPRRHHPV